MVQLSEAYRPYVLEIEDEVDGSAFSIALVARCSKGLPFNHCKSPNGQTGHVEGHHPTGPEAEEELVLMDATSDIPHLSPLDRTAPHWVIGVLSKGAGVSSKQTRRRQ